jgi:hypothetical protein
MGYAEATFMTLGVVVLLGVRSQRWWIAAAAGFLAGLTRPLGVLLAVPAFVEAVQHRRTLDRREVVARVAAVVAPGLGLFTYLAWASDRGDGFLYPLRVQEDAQRRGGWRFPLTNVIDLARDTGADRLSTGVHLATAAILVVLVAVLARRWPAAYSWYAGVVLVVALSASNLDSFERYALSTVPFVLAAADASGGDDGERILLSLSAAGLVAASVLAFTGVIVP